MNKKKTGINRKPRGSKVRNNLKKMQCLHKNTVFVRISIDRNHGLESRKSFVTKNLMFWKP